MCSENTNQVETINDTLSPQDVTNKSTGSALIETSTHTSLSSQDVTVGMLLQDITAGRVSSHTGYPVNSDPIEQEPNNKSSAPSPKLDFTNNDRNSSIPCQTTPTEILEPGSTDKITSQEVTNSADIVSQDVTDEITTTDPCLQRRKEHLHSLGLSDSVYSNNLESFYPVLTPEQVEVDYISFKDIIDTTWSVPLENLSANDIGLP